MNVPFFDLPGVLCRCQTSIETLFRRAGSPEDRAAGLADLLREHCPHARLTACLQGGCGVGPLAVRSASGSLDAAQNELLRSQMMSIDPLASGVQMLPGGRTRMAAISEGDRPRGCLALELPEDASPEEGARAEAVLTVCAATAALHGALDALRGERAELAQFALVGQSFLGLAHELNNALNSMMLQASVVQLRVDAQTRQDLAAIRQHGAQTAGLLRSLQHVVQERRAKFYAVDLNRVVAEVLEEEPELRQAVPAQLDAESPQIQGTHSAVKQFVRLVLQGVCAGTKAAVRLRTVRRDNGAELSLEIPEKHEAISDENAPQAADVVLWQNLDEVGRQAGQSLLRQLGGEMTVEQGSDLVLVLRVNWG